MGAGKTTIGRALAKRLNLEFIDSDRDIEARTGVSIPTVFEIEGEDGFRKREALVIDDLSRSGGRVVATGGGAVLRQDNRERLIASGLTTKPSCWCLLRRVLLPRDCQCAEAGTYER